MDASEFWCRAFLVAMRGSYSEHGEWENHGSPAAYAERAADAALAVAQRRGIVKGRTRSDMEPEFERVGFSWEKSGDTWIIYATGVPSKFSVAEGCDSVILLDDGRAARVGWSEASGARRPYEVWVERVGGAR
jgi:hypothetical protein